MVQAALVEDVLKNLLSQAGLAFDSLSVSFEQKTNATRIDITAPDPSRLIGWHGETLNSLQHLAKAIVRAKEKGEQNPFIILDVDGYRRQQEEKVRNIADQKADFVRRTGNRVALSPMSPYFRRIVHLHVAESPALQDLTTESIGQGDYRQIVLKLKDEKDAKIKSGEELSPVIAADDGLENLDI
ncbi:MAG: KH domain-containing protein [Candidatus Peribacteraceae bacterium]|nr:KH domain-containing protein [Candidatus Peribacteraceae bacterium]